MGYNIQYKNWKTLTQNKTSKLGFDALGDVLKPGQTALHAGLTNQTNTGISSGQQTGMQSQQQQQGGATQQQQQPGKVLTGDLDSSLASLAENLTINKSASAQVK